MSSKRTTTREPEISNCPCRFVITTLVPRARSLSGARARGLSFCDARVRVAVAAQASAERVLAATDAAGDDDDVVLASRRARPAATARPADADPPPDRRGTEGPGDGADGPDGVHQPALARESSHRDRRLADARDRQHLVLARLGPRQRFASRLQRDGRGVGRLLPPVHDAVRGREHQPAP